MTDHDDGRPNGRREFLSQLAMAGLVVSGAGCTSLAAHTTSSQHPAAVPVPSGSPRAWDDTWTARVHNKDSVVFDVAEIDGGASLSRAAMVMENYKEALGDDRLATVIVIRHMAIPMAFNDVLWDKYELGKSLKIDDPATGQPARRNPFLAVKPAIDQKRELIEANESLAELHARGAILLACNRAAMARAAGFAKKAGVDIAVAQKEVRENLVPGAILQPSGVYAIVRAQNVGCAFFR